MNVPSPTSNAEMPSLASTTPSAAPVPWPRLCSSLLAPLGGWRWLASERQPSATECSHPGEKPATALARARPRRLERYARAALIWGLLWYAVFHLFPLVLMYGTTEYPWHTVATAIEARKLPKLRRLVSEDPDRPLLLMLGSSRACWAFRAGDVDGMPDSDGRPLRVYNFGIPSTGPIFELLYLRDLLAEGIRPRFVLIEFNPPLLSERRRDALNEEDMMVVETIGARRLLQWLPYFHCPGKSVCRWLGAHLAPWSTFRHQIQLRAAFLTAGWPCPTYEAVDEWGWHLPLLDSWPAVERLYRLGLGYIGYYPQLSHYRFGKKPTQALHELLDLCRRERIPAALVIMPESSQFRSWYSNEAKTKLRGLLDGLSRTYGVAVIDANNWVADDDFEDGQHTLGHGAEVFTSRLRAELPRLLARSKAANSD